MFLHVGDAGFLKILFRLKNWQKKGIKVKEEGIIFTI